MGVRANRPREDPAARWDATQRALFGALDDDGALDRTTELPGGGTSSPRTMLAALTTDVLVHAWDLARSAQVDPQLDAGVCTRALADARRTGLQRGEGSLIGPEVAVAGTADAATKLAAFYGRDPQWSPPT